MKKMIMIFSLLMICFFSCASDKYMESDEIYYDIDFMANGDIPENFELYSNIIEHEKLFLSKCEKITDGNELLGEWILVDENGTSQSFVSYNLCNLTCINKYNEYYVLDNYGNRSFIYRNTNGRMYIYTKWLNIIRMIELTDNKLYFYITQDNKWVLDPIHKEGKLYFTKK